jgi:uncharacterized protein with gpF-like domain
LKKLKAFLGDCLAEKTNDNFNRKGIIMEESRQEETKSEMLVSEGDIETIKNKHENVKNYHATIGAMFSQMVRISNQAEAANEDMRNFVKNTMIQQGIPESEVENYVIRLTDGTIVKKDS